MRRKPDIVCLNCGKMFHPTRKGNTFCCRQCASEYNKLHGKYSKSEEIRKKLSEARKGKEPWNKGKKASAEAIEKFRESIKSVWTEEKRKEQSEKQKVIWSDPELLERHKEVMKESHSSEKTRQKISQKIHEYNMTLTEEDWTKRYKKAHETRSEKGTLYTSQGEISITEYVQSLGFNPIKYVEGKDETRFEIDCYIPEKKIGIEFNGIYFHSINGPNKRKIAYHFNKTKKAKDLGIDLIQIWEDQWNNNRELLKDIIAIRLGVINNKKIYARKCIVKEIDTKTYREFCLDNHIQGYRSASVKLGLYYEDNLVQIASFNKARVYSNTSLDKYEWEWIRGCSLQGVSVIGGSSKLFNYFISHYNPKNVLSYCDWNLFTGKSYEELGFTLLSYTGPDLFFVTNSSRQERINRNPYANSMHKQMVTEGKLYECHGVGSKKYVWHNEQS